MKDAEVVVVRAAVGEVFEVKLEGVPTAGYEWELVDANETADLVELVDREWLPAPGVLGGQAIQIFRFRARTPGTVELLFRYGRRWEHEPVGERLVRVMIESGARGS